MGKKSKFKKLSRIASQMPIIETKKVVGEKVSGSEVIKAGVSEINGMGVTEEGLFRKKTVVAVPINHKRQMKKLYNKHGAPGVGSYINAVRQHVALSKLKQQAKM